MKQETLPWPLQVSKKDGIKENEGYFFMLERRSQNMEY